MVATVVEEMSVQNSVPKSLMADAKKFQNRSLQTSLAHCFKEVRISVMESALNENNGETIITQGNKAPAGCLERWEWCGNQT